eukprot:1192435-Prorocentrum_minimum.AAC.3
MDKPQHEIPYIDIPLHQVICLEPSTYGTLEQRIDIGPKVPTPTFITREAGGHRTTGASNAHDATGCGC